MKLAEKPAGKKRDKLTAGQKAVLRALHQMPPGAWKKQTFATDYIGPNTWFVSSDEWRDACLEQAIVANANSFRGIKSQLKNAGHIGATKDQAWPIDQSQFEGEDQF